MKVLRGFALVAACTTVLAACADSMGPVDTDQGTEQGARLEGYRQLWSAARVKDYRMTVRLHGAWFRGAAVIEVRDGVPVSVTPVRQGDNPGHPPTFQHHDTVEELFAIVQRAVEQKAERLEVNYNQSVGVPVYVDVDIRFNWADDEHGFSVEDFRALK